ncbi:MAG: hypothetical protein Q8K61_12650 [Gallionella sp.]|nr:hypothetical protein [Gallionella sp.]
MSDYQFWENFTPDVLRVVAGSFVDFPVKLSNSNAGGGVAVRRYLDLPYLSISTLAAGQAEARSTAPANYAKAVKQMLAAKAGKLESYGVRTPEMDAQIEALCNAEINESGSVSLARKTKINTIVQEQFPRIPVPDEAVEIYHQAIKAASENPAAAPRLDRRLKQLIVFDADRDADVSITPLRAAALPELVSAAESRRAAIFGGLTDDEYGAIRFMKANAAKKEIDKLTSEGRKSPKLHRNLFPRCDLPLGGANPQNIGIGVKSSIRSPLLVSMPSIDTNLRKQFAVHYQGISPVDYAVAAKLLIALHQEKAAGYSVDSRFKEKMRSYASDIVSDMNYRSRIALSQLRAHAEDVNGDKACEDEALFDPAILTDKMQAGIFFNKQRDNAWRKSYADCVITYLTSIKFRPDGESALIRSSFSDSDAAIIRSTIEQELM